METQSTLNVLLVEDDDNHAKIISRHFSHALDEKINLFRASRLDEGLNYLSNQSFSAILLDLRLPDSGINETLKRTVTKAAQTPIIILSSLEDKNLARKMVHEGAQEYLCKANLSGDTLIRMIYSAMERKTLESKLHKAIESRDEFLSIASHELKTPLTSLKLQLQLAESHLLSDENSTPSKDKLAKALGLSINQVNRLNKLVDDLLDVSRIEGGKLSLSLENFDLNQLILEVAERFQGLFQQSKSTVKVILSGEALMISGDCFRVDQVIVNLLSNAIKYGDGKPIEISSSCTNENVVLSIKDHGIGIPKDQQGKLFKRFERAVSYMNISGLGLGLYISRQIVEAHHGTIQFVSEPGKGSTFIIQFPILELQSTAPTEQRLK